jgi:hypothetical protein
MLLMLCVLVIELFSSTEIKCQDGSDHVSGCVSLLVDTIVFAIAKVSKGMLLTSFDPRHGGLCRLCLYHGYNLSPPTLPAPVPTPQPAPPAKHDLKLL